VPAGTDPCKGKGVCCKASSDAAGDHVHPVEGDVDLRAWPELERRVEQVDQEPEQATAHAILDLTDGTSTGHGLRRYARRCGRSTTSGHRDNGGERDEGEKAIHL